MTNEEFKLLIHPSVITWESVKQVLAGPYSFNNFLLATGGNPILDDNIIFVSALIISPPFSTTPFLPYSYFLEPNEFAILISSSSTNLRNGVVAQNNIGAPVFLTTSSNGSIFFNNFSSNNYNGESYTFLLFRVN